MKTFHSDEVKKIIEASDFTIYQLEKGSESGRIHLQGYCQLKTKKRITGLKKLHGTAHWEASRGSLQQNIDYCSKSETRLDGPWRTGTGIEAGFRSDLLQSKKIIDETKSLKALAEDNFESFIRYHNGFQKYLGLVSSQEIRKNLVVHWY